MTIAIPTLHLFAPLDEKLIALLRSLSPDDWHSPTRAKQWTVKDIATHLLDGNLRTLSMLRDQYFGQPGPTDTSYEGMVRYLNDLNASWINGVRRLSPAVLVDLLEHSGREYIAYLHTLDPFGPAVFSVDWAGTYPTPNWFHIARDYTEKWHHQQQIREAMNRYGIASRELYYPVLDTFLQALPHHYRGVMASPGSTVELRITGLAGGEWYLVRKENGWQLTKEKTTPHTEITLDDDTAWKLFTKGLTLEEARRLVSIAGDSALGEPIYSMVAVMA